ncbi:AMP-binding protein [Kaistella jeonii]|uniref:AMP-dependent synthetase n=1 Tax=Kaistella jeonii TaxID=266749 RepID=A0A0C1CN59_9FLAO|nr:AMP-binding protein [Kaistella jeonii]KIA85446.1 AMP-dependent synthetase [Kaistella jeonii]SFC42731.1 O-succinylbenzoic acid--CoA ligase [Kaistella jeonii]VEI96808.1 2-succinylbenzoate--CoA ligase [Kaistella jeonii]
MTIDFSNFSISDISPETDFEIKVLAFLEEWLSNSQKVKVQTSGSTGAPKIFEVEKERMRHSAKMTCDILGLKERDSSLLCLPVEYISGKMMVVRAIERKLILFVKTPSSKPITDLTENIDFCAMSPLQVENSLDKLHLIKNLIIGGAAVSESLKNKIAQKLIHSTTQSHIFETYGMSETLSHIALKEIYPSAKDYFTALNGVELSLDERNCLQISAPQLNPELIKTNDLVEIKQVNESANDKLHFKFLGRIDNVINSAGLKIYPEELENLVKKEISNDVVFLGVKNQLLGQKLVLAIEGEENEIVKKQLEKIIYPTKNHRPKETIFIELFPRIPNGKIDRKTLEKLVKKDKG